MTIKDTPRIHRIGPHDMAVAAPDTPNGSIRKQYAVCTSDNWGLRYSDADTDPRRKGKLAYPVARDFAAAMYRMLTKDVQWGKVYFGSKGDAPKLKLEWPLNDESKILLIRLIKPVLAKALGSGNFALPADAMPTLSLEVPSPETPPGIGGTFSYGSWDLVLSLSQIERMFMLKGADTDINDQRSQMAPLSAFANSIYHECRHCQQSFWIFALVQANEYADTFNAIPNIAKWPGIAALTDKAKAIVNLAADYKFESDEPTVFASLTRMAVAQYLYTLAIWLNAYPQTDAQMKRPRFYPPFAPNAVTLQAEYGRVRTLAIDLLQYVGIGGTSIDVDAMVQEFPQCSLSAYSSRPWENDAFVCGDMETSYWNAGTGLALKTYSSDWCSHAYRFNYDPVRFSSDHPDYPAGE